MRTEVCETIFVMLSVKVEISSVSLALKIRILRVVLIFTKKTLETSKNILTFMFVYHECMFIGA